MIDIDAWRYATPEEIKENAPRSGNSEGAEKIK